MLNCLGKISKKIIARRLVFLANITNIIIIIMNLTADQPYNYAILIPSKHAGKPERSKNPCLNLLYTHYSPPAACSNYLAPATPTSLDLSPLNSWQPHYAMTASGRHPVEGFLRLPLIFWLAISQQEIACGRLPRDFSLTWNPHVGLSLFQALLSAPVKQFLSQTELRQNLY